MDITKIIIGYSFISSVIGLIIVAFTPYDYEWKSPIDYMTYILEKACSNRNPFGKILSSVSVVVLIPFLILLIMLQVVMLVFKFLVWVWKCGNKKD